MDDERIRQLAEEVLRDLRAPAPEGGDRTELEARVAALESEVARLRRQLPAAAEPPAVHVHVEAPHAHEPLREHPSHRALGPGIREGRCVVEPDKPCVHSGQCRSFGY